jgi:hypothetical protein
MPIEKECERCGKGYNVKLSRESESRYCGRLCLNQANAEKLKGVARKPRISKVCPRCGKTFETLPYKKNIYCSLKCRWYKLGFEPPPKAKMCAGCGGEFPIKPSQYDRVKCCSAACRKIAVANRSKPTLICRQCRKPFAAKRGQKFCGQFCMGMSYYTGGAVAAQYRRRARVNAAPPEEVCLEEIVARDKSSCYLCGKKLDRQQITLDHVMPLMRDGTHTIPNVRLFIEVIHQRSSLVQ